MTLDIFFIQYDEPKADFYFEKLAERFLYAKRIKSVAGIREAHLKAAALSKTENFYVVDADADVYDNFDFTFMPTEWDKHYNHVWYADNEVNGSCYGYGGIKLFHKDVLTSHDTKSTDFTTSTGVGLKVVTTPACATRFDQSSLLTFRSVVREVTKLSIQQQTRPDEDTELRLNQWKTRHPDTRYGRAYLRGLAAAADLLSTTSFEPTKLNDYTYLNSLHTQYVST